MGSPDLGFLRTACGGRTSPADLASSASAWISTGTGSQALEVWRSMVLGGAGGRSQSPTQSDCVDS